MVSPRIALRFRDFDPEVSTVAAHNAILESQGSVLWGWWKKYWEDNIAEELHEILKSEEIEFLLVDRTAKRQFRTIGRRVIFDHSEVHAELIPPYYREDREKVSAWFEFVKPIESIEYQDDLAKRFEEKTILILRPRETGGRFFQRIILHQTAMPAARPAIPPSILHMSDLHFGTDHNFRFNGRNAGLHGARVGLADAILRDVDRQGLIGQIGVIALSGDITSAGAWDQGLTDGAADSIRALADGLRVPLERVVIAPGNHDVVRQTGVSIDIEKPIVSDAIRYDHEDKFRIFRNLLLGTQVREPLNVSHEFDMGEFSLHLGVLNSSNLTAVQFPEYGYVGDGVENVLRAMRRAANPSIKVLLLHHHLLPIRRIDLAGKSVSVTLDASNILEQSQKEGVRLILHGHQHIPKLVKTSRTYKDGNGWRGLENEDIFVFANGSAGSNRLEQGLCNVYSILRFAMDRTELICRSINPADENLGDYLRLHLPIRVA